MTKPSKRFGCPQTPAIAVVSGALLGTLALGAAPAEAFGPVAPYASPPAPGTGAGDGTVPNPSPRPGASATPAGATPQASPSLRPAGLFEVPAFGSILALRQVNGERSAIALDGADPAVQPFGTSSNRYLTLSNGLEYTVHWDDAAVFAKLKVGDTVNVYPTRDAVCIDHGTGPDDCRVLVRLLPANHFIPPLQAF